MELGLDQQKLLLWDVQECQSVTIVWLETLWLYGSCLKDCESALQGEKLADACGYPAI